MSEALYRLVYYSRNRIPGGSDEVARHVRSILERSRTNNMGAGVTGALMFNAGCFAQVLEGDRKDVESTFERIQQDERHGEVHVLAFGPVARRTFPDWSMAFVGASRDDAERFAGIAEQSGFDLARMTGDRVQDILLELLRDEELTFV